MRKGSWKLVMLRDFSKGAVTRPGAHILSQGEWAELQNTRLDEKGSAKKRGGTTEKTANPLLRYE